MTISTYSFQGITCPWLHLLTAGPTTPLPLDCIYLWQNFSLTVSINSWTQCTTFSWLYLLTAGSRAALVQHVHVDDLEDLDDLLPQLLVTLINISIWWLMYSTCQYVSWFVTIPNKDISLAFTIRMYIKCWAMYSTSNENFWRRFLNYSYIQMWSFSAVLF